MNRTTSSSTKKSQMSKAPKPAISTQNSEVDEEDVDESIEVKFERELAWCKDHIYEKLHHVELDSKQGYDLARCLKILNSEKAVMIKKRQAMRTTLGDYRKIMKENAKIKLTTDAKKKEDKTKTSKCLKLSTSTKVAKHDPDCCSSLETKVSNMTVTSLDKTEEPSSKEDSNSNIVFKSSENSFKFNFSESNTTASDGSK